MTTRAILGAFAGVSVLAFGVFWYSMTQLEAAPPPTAEVNVATRNTAQGRGPGAQQNPTRELHSVEMPGQVFQEYARQDGQGQGPGIQGQGNQANVDQGLRQGQGQGPWWARSETQEN